MPAPAVPPVRRGGFSIEMRKRIRRHLGCKRIPRAISKRRWFLPWVVQSFWRISGCFSCRSLPRPRDSAILRLRLRRTPKNRPKSLDSSNRCFSGRFPRAMIGSISSPSTSPIPPICLAASSCRFADGQSAVDVRALSSQERSIFTSATDLLDWTAGPFQEWLGANKLRPAQTETDLDLARRIFVHLKEQANFEFKEDVERRVCAVVRR